jgi:hypothetical protein
MIISLLQNPDQTQSNELIRRSGSSTGTLHHHCPPDSTPKVRSIKRDMNQKIARKDYEIKTLKQVCLIFNQFFKSRIYLSRNYMSH